MSEKEYKNILNKKDKRIANLKSVVSSHRERLRQQGEYLKTLSNQYEKVIKIQRKQIQEYINNAPKLFYIYMVNKFKKK